MANIGTLTVVIDGETFKLTKALKKAETQTKQFTKKATTGYKSMKQSILSARSAVIAFGAVGTLLIGKIFGKAVKEAMDFQYEMGKVNSLVKDTELTFGELSDGVRDLSKEFGVAKADLAKGMFDIISATVQASEAMGVLRASTRLAVGGFTEVSQATKAVIVTYQTFKDQLKDVADAADFLFAIQERGILTVADVAKNIGVVAAIAKSAGLSVEDLGASFAIISRTGVGAEKSVVQLSRLIETFTKKVSPEAMDAANKYGVVLTKNSIANGKFLSTLLKLKDATSKEISMIFRDVRAKRGFVAITTRASEVDEDLATQLERTGLAANAEAEAMELYTTKIKQFTQNLNELKEALGGVILPALIKFTDTLIKIKDTGNIWAFMASPLQTVALMEAQEGLENLLAKGANPAITGMKGPAMPGGFSSFPQGMTTGEAEQSRKNKEEYDAQIEKYELFKEKGKKWLEAKAKIDLSAKDFAIYQFEEEAKEFKILVDHNIAGAQEFEDFKTASLQKITLENSKAYQAMQSAVIAWGDEFADTLTDMVMGAEVSFANIFESFSRMIINMAIKTQMIQPLMAGLFGESAGGSGSGLVGSLAGILGTAIGGGFGGGASFNSLNAEISSSAVGTQLEIANSPALSGLDLGWGGLNAEGGIATKPTAGIFGEAGAEALIPLDRLKDIGGNVTVNIIGAPEGTQVQESESKQGGRSIDVILDEKMSQQVKPGSKFNNSMLSQFNDMQQSTIRR